MYKTKTWIEKRTRNDGGIKYIPMCKIYLAYTPFVFHKWELKARDFILMDESGIFKKAISYDQSKYTLRYATNLIDCIWERQSLINKNKTANVEIIKYP